MNPSKRYNWTEAFQEFRAWIDSITPSSVSSVRCGDCGRAIYLVFGRHSRKWFYSHDGLAGCESARAIMFDTKEQAQQATEVFQ